MRRPPFRRRTAADVLRIRRGLLAFALALASATALLLAALLATLLLLPAALLAILLATLLLLAGILAAALLILIAHFDHPFGFSRPGHRCVGHAFSMVQRNSSSPDCAGTSAAVAGSMPVLDFCYP